jgi:hypothetical protein
MASRLAIDDLGDALEEGRKGRHNRQAELVFQPAQRVAEPPNRNLELIGDRDLLSREGRTDAPALLLQRPEAVRASAQRRNELAVETRGNQIEFDLLAPVRIGDRLECIRDFKKDGRCLLQLASRVDRVDAEPFERGRVPVSLRARQRERTGCFALFLVLFGDLIVELSCLFGLLALGFVEGLLGLQSLLHAPAFVLGELLPESLFLLVQIA